MPMPAFCESLRTVSTSQRWRVPSEPSITCAPVDHFAIDFEISSEMIAPPKPRTAEKARSGPSWKPSWAIT